MTTAESFRPVTSANRTVLLSLCALTLLVGAMPAAAQLSRVGGTNVVHVFTPGANLHTDAAYDPKNDVYLVVDGYGPIFGTFVNSSGVPVTSTFTIFTPAGNFGLMPTTRYSPDVSNGAGGTGGFLVAWHDGSSISMVQVAIVSYESSTHIVAGPTVVSGADEGGGQTSLSGPAIAYSVTSKRFLVAWSTGLFSIRARFVDTAGAPIGSSALLLENAGGSMYPSLVWNSATNEFGLVYAQFGSENGAPAWISFRRIGVDGTVFGRVGFGYSLGTFTTAIDVNASNNYVAAWALGGQARTEVIDQSGALVTGAAGTYVTDRLGFNQSLAWAFNGTSNSFLLASSDAVSYDIGAIETDGAGNPSGSVIVATEGGTAKNGGSYYPLVTAHKGSPQWLLAYMVNGSALGQIMASGGVTPPPPPTCTVSATATAPTLGAVGVAQGFTATATVGSACGTAATYAWSFGDGGSSASQNPSYTYSTAGTYTWSLTVSAGTGGGIATTTKTGSIQVLAAGACIPTTATVNAQPAQVTLSDLWQGSGTTVTAGQLLTITATGQTWVSGGTTYTAAGDAGTILTGANVPMSGAPKMALVGRIGTGGTPFLIGAGTQFTPTVSGALYLAPNHEWYNTNNSGSLTVSLCRGGTTCSVDATATVPTAANVGSSVSFTATGTPSGCGTVTPTYAWNFGDGATGSGQSPTHTYSTAGTYTWTVTITAGTASTTKTGSISVLASGVCVPSTETVLANPFEVGGTPTLTTMWADTGVAVTAGQMLTVSLAGSQTWADGGVSYTAAGNASDIISASSANVPLPGGPRMALVGRIGASGTPFLIGLWSQAAATASGNLYLAPNDEWYALNNNTGSLSVTVCVGGSACAPSVTATVPTSGVPGTAVSFAATCSLNNCGASPATTYAWTFGDGGTSTSQNPTHTYAADGTYSWTLTVTTSSSGVVTGTTNKSGSIVVATPTCTASTATISPNGTGTNLPGSQWQTTGATVTSGQAVSITATGTWRTSSAGAALTAAGDSTDLTTYDGVNSPMSGSPRLALVGRIGDSGTPFLVGTSMTFTATTSGALYLAPNDIWYSLHDNTGSVSAAICIGAACTITSATATAPSWATMGRTASFTASSTTTGCTSAATYSWNFGDGSTSTSQNPTHAYAAVGAYTWTLTVQAGTATATRTGSIKVTGAANDFDGDAVADVAVFRPSSGGWFWLKSSTSHVQAGSASWGVPTDIPVPGDYDGDGLIDPAVYRPSTGSWMVLTSSSSFTSWTSVGWGTATDTPVPGDYDGDGKTDVAIYRPSTGAWQIKPSSGAASWSVTFGKAGDVPVLGDFDGDGKRDPAVYRASTGTWFWLLSSTSYTTYQFKGWGVQAQGDTPAPGDYDGDGKTDLCVVRPATGTWYVLLSAANFTTWSYFGWGTTGDTPVAADYDGDGKTDGAVYRASTATWYIKPSSGAAQWTVVYGSTGDAPLSTVR